MPVCVLDVRPFLTLSSTYEGRWQKLIPGREELKGRTQRVARVLKKRTETEVQIEKIRPLKDPTSHNPKKKDNISLVNVMRHKESCLTLGSRDTAEEVPDNGSDTRSGGSKLGQRREE